MIVRYKPCFTRQEFTALLKYKKSSINRFESEFANFINNKYAISFPYARSGLYALLKSLNMKNCEIIVPAYTSISVPLIIVKTGNIPKFVDISLYDYNSKIEDIISRISDKTKAIIPTHMFGYPIDVKKLKKLIPDDILIFEDAALSIKNHIIAKYGDISFFSLGIKQLTTSDGGIISTNNKELYLKLKEFKEMNFLNSSYKNFKKYLAFILTYIAFIIPFYYIYLKWENQFRVKYFVHSKDSSEHNLDYFLPKDFLINYTKSQAKVGSIQIKKCDEYTKKRKKIAQIYNDLLSNVKNINLPPLIANATYSHYTIMVENRDIFMKKMQKKGVQTDLIFPYAAGNLKMFKKYATEKYPNSILASQKVVNLPIYPDLLRNEEKIKYVAKCVKECI